MFPPLRDSPRDPALMRMQMEVPSSPEKPQYLGLPQIRSGVFLQTRLKPTEITGFTFYCPPGSCEVIRAISFLTDKFH